MVGSGAFVFYVGISVLVINNKDYLLGIVVTFCKVALFLQKNKWVDFFLRLLDNMSSKIEYILAVRFLGASPG
jgi:hypothetical protein